VQWHTGEVGDLMPRVIETVVEQQDLGPPARPASPTGGCTPLRPAPRRAGIDTGTAAAAAGGVTTLIDMPLNSDPCTTTVKLLQEKISSAQVGPPAPCPCALELTAARSLLPRRLQIAASRGPFSCKWCPAAVRPPSAAP
jgi:hypothetical protein